MELLNFLKNIETSSDVFAQSRELFAGDRRLRESVTNEDRRVSVTKDQKRHSDQKSGTSVTDQKSIVGYGDEYFTGVRSMTYLRCPHPFCKGVAPKITRIKSACFACMEREQTEGRVGIFPRRNPQTDNSVDQVWCHIGGIKCHATVMRDVGSHISILPKERKLVVNNRAYELPPDEKQYNRDVWGTLDSFEWVDDELMMKVDGVQFPAPLVVGKSVKGSPVAFPPLSHPGMDVEEYLPKGPLGAERYQPLHPPALKLLERAHFDNNDKMFQDYQRAHSAWVQENQQDAQPVQKAKKATYKTGPEEQQSTQQKAGRSRQTVRAYVERQQQEPEALGLAEEAKAAREKAAAAAREEAEAAERAEKAAAAERAEREEAERAEAAKKAAAARAAREAAAARAAREAAAAQAAARAAREAAAAQAAAEKAAAAEEARKKAAAAEKEAAAEEARKQKAREEEAAREQAQKEAKEAKEAKKAKKAAAKKAQKAREKEAAEQAQKAREKAAAEQAQKAAREAREDAERAAADRAEAEARKIKAAPARKAAAFETGTAVKVSGGQSGVVIRKIDDGARYEVRMDVGPMMDGPSTAIFDASQVQSLSDASTRAWIQALSARRRAEQLKARLTSDEEKRRRLEGPQRPQGDPTLEGSLDRQVREATEAKVKGKQNAEREAERQAERRQRSEEEDAASLLQDASSLDLGDLDQYATAFPNGVYPNLALPGAGDTPPEVLPPPSPQPPSSPSGGDELESPYDLILGIIHVKESARLHDVDSALKHLNVDSRCEDADCFGRFNRYVLTSGDVLRLTEDGSELVRRHFQQQPEVEERIRDAVQAKQFVSGADVVAEGRPGKLGATRTKKSGEQLFSVRFLDGLEPRAYAYPADALRLPRQGEQAAAAAAAAEEAEAEAEEDEDEGEENEEEGEENEEEGEENEAGEEEEEEEEAGAAAADQEEGEAGTAAADQEEEDQEEEAAEDQGEAEAAEETAAEDQGKAEAEEEEAEEEEEEAEAEDQGEEEEAEAEEAGAEPVLSEYEQQRLQRIQSNSAHLKALGLEKIVQPEPTRKRRERTAEEMQATKKMKEAQTAAGEERKKAFQQRRKAMVENQLARTGAGPSSYQPPTYADQDDANDAGDPTYYESESHHETDDEDEEEEERAPTTRPQKKRKRKQRCEDGDYDGCMEQGESVLNNTKTFGSDLEILPSKEIDWRGVPWTSYVPHDKTAAASFTDAQLPLKLREAMHPHIQYIMYDDGQGYRYVCWHKDKRKYRIIMQIRDMKKNPRSLGYFTHDSLAAYAALAVLLDPDVRRSDSVRNWLVWMVDMGDEAAAVWFKRLRGLFEQSEVFRPYLHLVQLDDRTPDGDIEFVKSLWCVTKAHTEKHAGKGPGSKNFKVSKDESERRADVAVRKGLSYSEAELHASFRTFVQRANEKGLSEFDLAKRVLQGAIDEGLTLREMNFVFGTEKGGRYPFALRYDVLRELGISAEAIFREGMEASELLGPRHYLDPKWAVRTGATWDDVAKYIQQARAARRQRNAAVDKSSTMSPDDKQSLKDLYVKLNAVDKAEADRIIATRRPSSTVMMDDDEEGVDAIDVLDNRTLWKLYDFVNGDEEDEFYNEEDWEAAGLKRPEVPLTAADYAQVGNDGIADSDDDD